MRISLHRGRLAAAAVFAIAAPGALPGSLWAQAAGYLDHDALTREVRALADGSDAIRMSSAGRSLEGRDVWVVEIANRDGPPVGERPALLVVGTLTGDHVLGSHLALGIVRHFAEAADDPDVGRILAENVVYVFPRANPDGAEAMFAGTRWNRRGNARPVDDDNDGRTDEDGPEDLNGDGMVTLMRAPDPGGAYVADSSDARLLREADAARGESGAWKVYFEGTDEDGDGYINEDGPGGVDLGRNFQHAYPYYAADAGASMVSEPESRALMDFVVAHRNIAAILTFGPSDNLVTPPDARGELAGAAALDLTAFAHASNEDVYDVGMVRGAGGGFGFIGGQRLRGAQPGRDNDPSSGRRPSTTVHREDQQYFRTVSEAYRDITGIEELGVTRAPEGDFFQFGYFQYGVPSFVTPGWGLPGPASAEGAEEPTPARGGGRGGDRSTDARVLAAMDAAGIDAFVPWAPFQHPELGEVEIGGFRPYVLHNPPAAALAELGDTHGRFAVRLAGMLPRVRVVDAEVTAHGGGIYTVEAEVENIGYFPTSTQHGVVSGSVDPTIVQIQVPPEDIVSGDDKTARIQRLEGSSNRERFLWVIRGRDGQGVDIRVRAQKGGTDTRTVTLGG